MKQKIILCLLLLSSCISFACGTKNNSVTDSIVTDEPIASIASEPLTEPSVTEIVDKENQDPYVGEYNDFDWNEPNLEIEKNKDGSYEIEIGIYRISTFQNCKGTLVDDKIEFHKEIADGEIKLKGTIELDDDIATVTFTSKDWAEYSSINTYPYKKSSNKPFDKHKKYVF